MLQEQSNDNFPHSPCTSLRKHARISARNPLSGLVTIREIPRMGSVGYYELRG